MVESNDTSKTGPTRNPTEDAASAALSERGSAGNPNAPSPSPPSAPPRNTLEQAIETERAQLLRAHGVLRCLYEVLLHADGEDAVCYAEAAYVAASLINESAGRLDLVRLKPMIEALKDA